MSRRKVNRQDTRPLHIMLIPAVVVLLVYQYLPIAGNVIAFQKFDIYLGLRAFL